MVTNERLTEIEAAPREAYICKAEAKEIVQAYRNHSYGLRVTNNADGVWLHFESPSGKKAAINCEALGIRYAGLTGAAILEWAESIAQPAAQEK